MKLYKFNCLSFMSKIIHFIHAFCYCLQIRPGEIRAHSLRISMRISRNLSFWNSQDKVESGTTPIQYSEGYGYIKMTQPSMRLKLTKIVLTFSDMSIFKSFEFSNRNQGKTCRSIKILDYQTFCLPLKTSFDQSHDLIFYWMLTEVEAKWKISNYPIQHNWYFLHQQDWKYSGFVSYFLTDRTG